VQKRVLAGLPFRRETQTRDEFHHQTVAAICSSLRQRDFFRPPPTANPDSNCFSFQDLPCELYRNFAVFTK
jgi:hypothetical protein